MKTIKEAAEEKYGNDPHKYACQRDGFIAGAEFAQRWISVEEEPPKNEWLNVKNEDKLNSFLTYGVVKITGAIDVKFVFHNFTHWRPIEIK